MILLSLLLVTFGAFHGIADRLAPPTTVAAVAPATGPVLATLGDSITEGDAGLTYATSLAATLGLPLVNLAIGNEFSGPVDFTLPPKIGNAHIVNAGVLADEVGKIPVNATIVTLYIGTNDAWMSNLGALPDNSNTVALAQTAARAYAKNIPAIVAGIKARVPNAKIYLATLPNPAWRQVNVTENAVGREASTLFASSVKTALVATGLPVVDLLCDPAMYEDDNFKSKYDPHPVKAGFDAIAAAFVAQIRHPKPVGHCKYEKV